MALAVRTNGCHSCRQWLLRSFLAGLSGSSTTSFAPYQRRAFSRPQRRLNIRQDEHPLNEINGLGNMSIREPRSRVGTEMTEQAATEPQVASGVGGEVQNDETQGNIGARLNGDVEDPVMHDQGRSTEGQDGSDESLEQSELPWYLQPQHHSLQYEQSPMAARQCLPDLPEHAPPILLPLLEHVSIELGMDDLSLLDLRALDPPPALGTNLLMVIGTARSEKHLHVSADKLCRWLRSEPFGLTPFADGLLGRNELKLKMRRRAKKTRLMAGVGAKATADTELDEGIRTGWVCVNVGRVEGGELPELLAEKRQREESFVGFGSETAGSSIVVQLMTEEKRDEINLEKLWTGALNRSKREREAGEKEIDGAKEHEPAIDAVVQAPI